jgi:hypothetical protein
MRDRVAFLASLLFLTGAVACGGGGGAHGSGDGGGKDASTANDGASGSDTGVASADGGPSDGSASDGTVTSADGGPTDAAMNDASTDGAPGDGSPSVPDGATSTDGEAPNDAGTDAKGGGSCGGTTCIPGQTCVSGECVFAGCSGVTVPGDYPTIQSALTALEASDGGTICLGPQTYAESIDINTGVPITLWGVSSEKTTVQGSASAGARSSAKIALKGVSFVGLAGGFAMELSAFEGSATVTGCAFESAAADSLTVTAEQSHFDITHTKAVNTAGGNAITVQKGPDTGTTFTVVLDGVDATTTVPTSGAAVLVTEPSDNATMTLTIQNSYLHGCRYGVAWTAPGGTTGANDTITFDANTILSNGTGIDWEAELGPGNTLSYYDNLFVQNGIGVLLAASGGSPSAGYNLYYGNTTNYSGVATKGTGDLTANPLLDTSVTPPGLKPGSPARGAGIAAHAPADDFWGKPRGKSIDIGAVESP